MRIFLCAFLIMFFCLGCKSTHAQKQEWQELEPGIALKIIHTKKHSIVGNSQIVVVRFDPQRWDLVFLGVSNTAEKSGLTARQWSEKYHLKAAINAGMFNPDYRTHTGFLQSGNHINNPTINHYQSVAAFHPKHKNIPPFRIFDLDIPGISIKSIQKDYASVVQNLRLIKRPGINRWSQQKKMWSEAALGEDKEGRILFIFARSPFTMHDFNNELLTAGIGIVAAQHLEGGPVAQLYVNAGKKEINLFGSYETDFNENDWNNAASPVPNILGIQAK